MTWKQVPTADDLRLPTITAVRMPLVGVAMVCVALRALCSVLTRLHAWQTHVLRVSQAAKATCSRELVDRLEAFQAQHAAESSQ